MPSIRPNTAARMPFLKGSGLTGESGAIALSIHGGLYVGGGRARVGDALGGHLSDRVDDLFGPPRIGIFIAQ